MDQERIQAYRDEQKRLAEEQAIKDDQRRNSDRVSKSVLLSNNMVAKSVATDGEKSRKELQQVIDSINRMNVTTFMASKDNWATVVEDMAQAAERIQNVINGLNDGGVQKIEKSFTDAVTSLNKIVREIRSVKVETDDDVKRELADVADALRAVQLNPVINVSSPDVTVESAPVDLEPLQKTLDKHLKPKPEPLDLRSFMAQDLTGDDSFQYVGFVSPVGKWYIIENDINGGSLRYKFGKNNYKSSWKDHTNQTYRVLNEAIREIQA